MEAHAALRLFAPDLDPSEVTRMLELPPDSAHRRGDLRISRTKRGKVKQCSPYSQGLWSMSSQSWVESPRLGTHVEWLLEQVEPKAEALAYLAAQGVSADVFCFSLGRTSALPPVPRVLRTRLKQLGLHLDIDHYELNPEDCERV